MSTLTAVVEIIQLIADLTPGLIKTYEDAKPFAEAVIKVTKGEVVADDEVQKLRDRLDELSNQLDKPLSPE